MLVLASGSPRRLDLLRQIGIDPDKVDPPDVDEAQRKGETPLAMTRRLAEDKASSAATRNPEAFVLAADTVVVCGRRVLPKPPDEAAARRCLETLSGRGHRVLGGLCVIAPDGRRAVRAIVTAVRFKRLTVREIERYIAGGEWHGRAGGYAIQGTAAAFVKRINGSYTNVVGLPLYETVRLLGGLGFVTEGDPI